MRNFPTARPIGSTGSAICTRPTRRAIDIEVDGGITADNAPLVAHAGANVLVAGSAVLKGGSNYRANIAAIRNAAALARGEAA